VPPLVDRLTVVVPETVAPWAGLAIDAVSGAGPPPPPFCTVTLTLADPLWVALETVAVRVRGPSPVSRVSQARLRTLLLEVPESTVVPPTVSR
jgi:hypothetical protein